MTTAQILFEQYKVLPKRIQQQLRQLILQADQPATQSPMVKHGEEEEAETSDTIQISLEALHSSIEQVKLLRAGKLQTQSAYAMLAEVEAELTAEDAVKAEQTKKAA